MPTRLPIATALAITILAAATPHAAAQPCIPEVSPRFAPGNLIGSCRALLRHDHAAGSDLYAGGDFAMVENIPGNRVARWTEHGWEPLGAVFNQRVEALAMHNGELYAAGWFSMSGASPCNFIARWTGTDWEPVGPGLNHAVYALASFDEDGPGPNPPMLFAGGRFSMAGTNPAMRLARWDGTTWTAVGAGLNQDVLALHVHDDGTGPSLYIGGQFSEAGGLPAGGIARWDGAAFSAVGGDASGPVQTLHTFDADGPGGAPPDLIIGGNFASIDGVFAQRVARWNGSAWAPMGSGANAMVLQFATYDDGAGESLYMAGTFTRCGIIDTNHIARWDGVAWRPVTGLPTSSPNIGFGTFVYALASFDDGRGERLLASSSGPADGLEIDGLAAWNGDRWIGQTRGVNDPVSALAAHDDGSGPALYMTGYFEHVDGMFAPGIVKFSNNTFSPLGAGVYGNLFALASFDEGEGPRLFLGGLFGNVGPGQAINIARWDGQQWTPLIAANGANGLLGTVRAFKVWDDGSGPALFVGGDFTNPGGHPGARIAKWTGADWVPLGSGVNAAVFALEVYQNQLYAAGDFTSAGGAPASHIARWDGSAWSEVGGGINANLNALAVYDGTLYAGGQFTLAGGSVNAKNVAAWNGSQWSAAGAGLDNAVIALASIDENGPQSGGHALYAGCTPIGFAGPQNPKLARWDGSQWSEIPVGPDSVFTSVRAIAGLDAGPDAGLYIGGDFRSVEGVPSSNLARFACTGACYANCDNSTAEPTLNIADFSCFLQRFAAGDAYANCDQSTIPPVLNIADFTCYLQHFAAGCP